MVEKDRLLEQLRKLKKKINSDPQVKAIYDLDGDGNISGDEWEKARKTVIAFMEAQEAGKAGGQKQSTATAGVASAAIAGVAGAADQVFNQIKGNIAHEDEPEPGTLFSESKIIVEQQVERLEMITDFEGRNKYKLFNEARKELANAEESDTGALGVVLRNLWTSRRAFTLGISVYNTPYIIWLKRRFQFFFSRIEVSDDDAPVGAVQQKFSLLHRKYELESYLGDRILTVSGPIFRPWTFNIMSGINQVGSIKKKWSGIFKEAFTRADTFLVSFDDPKLTMDERKLILAAAIAIDIDFFEQNQSSNTGRI